LFIVFGLVLYLGAIFVRDNESAKLLDMFTAVYAILFSSIVAGNNFYLAPDAAACQSAAANIFHILDSVD